ncbi:MAG: hypothetical protein ACYDFU_02300 [Nitrospirota bacterium]
MKGSGYIGRSMFLIVVFGALLSCAVAAYAGSVQFMSGYPRLDNKNILMQWLPVPGASGYKVYRSEGRSKAGVIGTTKVNRFIDKNIPAGKTLHYSVAVVVGGKETAKTPAWTITTAAKVKKVFIPLRAPRLVGVHLKQEPGNKYSVGIRWENAAGSNMVGVNIYRSTVKGKDFALIGSSSTDMYDDNNVKPGVSYYYVATSVDSQFNETKYSNELSVSVPSPAKVQAEEKAAEKEAEPTAMRSAKLLFRIPDAEEAKDRDANPYMAMDVAVDEAVGHIYVTSQLYGGVLVYDLNGKYQFGIRKDGVNGQDKFVTAMGVAVGRDGNIYVSDYSSPTISIFDFTGKPVGTIDIHDSKLPEYKKVLRNHATNHKISIGKDGKIYISDPAVDSIHVYDADNRHLYDWTGAKSEEEKRKYHAKLLINGPAYSAVLNNGDLAVVDSGMARVQVLDKNGNFKNFIGKYGTAAGEFYFPSGVAVDRKGNVFVGLGQSPNIQVFSPEGKFLYALSNEKGNGSLPISASNGIAIDSHDRLYVTEGMAGRVSVFQLQEKTKDVVPPAK